MKLKGTQGVLVDYTEAGTIVLEQQCDITDEMHYVYLTLEQFRIIQDWVKLAEPNIEHAWNKGVDNDFQS